MHSFTDEQLMDIYQHNSEGRGQHAFDLLYLRYAQKMLSFFYFSLNNNTEKAQDFVHDLFVKIIEQAQKFDSKHYFKAWIYSIASNMCKNEFRSNEVVQKYKNHVLNTENEAFDTTNDKTLRTCLNQLSTEQRSLIVLRFKMNLSIKEIAQICNCPEGTIKSRLFYATKELSKLYQQ